MNKIAFIGVGNMANAIIGGITKSRLFPMSDIILYNRTIEKVECYRSKGAYIAYDLHDAVKQADCIFLCVKPQNFPEILSEIATISGVENKLFVTIAAGISIETVSNAAHGAAVVRAMPNTPMLISQGVVAICRSTQVSDADFAEIKCIFAACGKVIVIDESDMNKIICVTGSSPAYIFMLIHAMLEGAKNQGLISDDNALSLHQQDLIDSICDTIIGTAALMKTGNKSPIEQIQAVASKGGTTERAISELERFKFCEAIISAMQKCTDRADELSAEKA